MPLRLLYILPSKNMVKKSDINVWFKRFQRLREVPVDEIDHGAKLLWFTVWQLMYEKGFCWATNKKLAVYLGGVDKSTVSGWVSDLSNAGWLEVYVDKSGGNRRKLIATEPIPANSNTPIGTQQASYAGTLNEAEEIDSDTSTEEIDDTIGTEAQQNNRVKNVSTSETETIDRKRVHPEGDGDSEPENVRTEVESVLNSQQDFSELPKELRAKILLWLFCELRGNWPPHLQVKRLIRNLKTLFTEFEFEEIAVAIWNAEHNDWYMGLTGARTDPYTLHWLTKPHDHHIQEFLGQDLHFSTEGKEYKIRKMLGKYVPDFKN